jgi:hypothetical protein
MCRVSTFHSDFAHVSIYFFRRMNSVNTLGHGATPRMYGAGGIARIVDSATDNEDGPVETRRTDAQRQEKEEDDYDGEQAAAPEPKMRPCHQGSHAAKSRLAF